MAVGVRLKARLKVRWCDMATYEEYLEHAKSKKFQPVKEDTFNSLTKAGFDPITNSFEPKSSKGSSTGGGGAMPKSNRDITKNYKFGGKVSSASSRADGCAIKGKTKGRMV